MKGFYDKIILAVGVLALAASGAYYASMKTEVEGDVSQTPFGPEYENLAAQTIQADFRDWPEPTPQDEAGKQKYDVFTPPKIWWEPDAQQFIFQLPEDPPLPPPFGLRLVSMEQDLYRIQFEAYFEALDGREENASILLFDYDTNTSFRGTVGDAFPEHDAEIVDFSVKRVVNEETGTIRLVPRVTVLDKESGERITLTTEERLYIPNSYQLHFQTLGPELPVETFTWEKKGDTKSVADVTFKLLDFVFDKQTADVEKTFANEEFPTETETLSVAEQKPAAPQPQPVPAEENSPESENPGGIDSLFQN